MASHSRDAALTPTAAPLCYSMDTYTTGTVSCSSWSLVHTDQLHVPLIHTSVVAGPFGTSLLSGEHGVNQLRNVGRKDHMDECRDPVSHVCRISILPHTACACAAPSLAHKHGNF